MPFGVFSGFYAILRKRFQFLHKKGQISDSLHTKIMEKTYRIFDSLHQDCSASGFHRIFVKKKDFNNYRKINEPHVELVGEGREAFRFIYIHTARVISGNGSQS